MKKFIAILLAVLSVMVIFASCGDGNSPEKEEVKDNSFFAGVTSTDLNGNEIDSSMFKGKKLTMVNIWGTFCGPCINEMPDLQKISEDYADKDFQIFGMICDIADEDDVETIDLAKEIVEMTGVKYPNIMPSETLSPFLNSLFTLPLTIFLDENGEQVASFEGSRSYDGWVAIIDSLLAPPVVEE